MSLFPFVEVFNLNYYVFILLTSYMFTDVWDIFQTLKKVQFSCYETVNTYRTSASWGLIRQNKNICRQVLKFYVHCHAPFSLCVYLKFYHTLAFNSLMQMYGRIKSYSLFLQNYCTHYSIEQVITVLHKALVETESWLTAVYLGVLLCCVNYSASEQSTPQTEALHCQHYRKCWPYGTAITKSIPDTYTYILQHII